MSYLNRGVLSGGCIKPKTECPYYKRCKHYTGNCPTIENGNVRDKEFSCGLARLFSIEDDPRDSDKGDNYE